MGIFTIQYGWIFIYKEGPATGFCSRGQGMFWR